MLLSPKRLIPAAATVVLTLVLMSAGAQARVQATGASPAAGLCTTETIPGNSYIKTITFRFVLQGHVSCSEAHRTMRAYIRAARAGRCPSRICTEVLFPGGWTCSTSSSVEVRDGAALSGCQRRGAIFSVYKASPGGPPGAFQSLSFRSADGKVWCIDESFEGDFWCGGPGLTNSTSQHGATLHKNGNLKLCDVPVVSFSQACFQNWDPHAPLLPLGQQNYIDGFLCKSAANGITCTPIAGPGKGKGFRVNKDEAVKIGPSSAVDTSG